MINKLLVIFFCFLIINTVVSIIRIDKRLVTYTDTIKKYESGRSGGSGSRSDQIDLVSKEYYLYRGYHVTPTVLIAIKRKKLKNHEGEQITYYFDPDDIENANKFKHPSYTAIAGEINGENKKNIWYWFSLIAYVVKHAGFFISFIPVIGLVFIVIGYKPDTSFELTFYLFVCVCFIIWGVVF